LNFINKYPNANWQYLYLSSNPCITIEYILLNKDKKWDWNEIFLRNPNISIKIIEKYIDKTNWGWGLYELSKNPNITVEFIEKHIDKINFDGLSRNKFTYHNKLIEQISNKISIFYYLSFPKNIIYDIRRYIVTNFI